ncbi:MAG: hypothetical protein L0Z62_42210 [Gemmataceae bacterium]|nr:hypothetical protein [Gemmataceae bacterium]
MDSAARPTSASLSALPVSLCAALRELLKAHELAERHGLDVWEFSVTINGLRGLALTETDLRWLVQESYVQHGIEKTRPQDPRRVFRRPRSLALTEVSCFVLTAAGVNLARQRGGALEEPSPGSQIPEAARAPPAAPESEVPSWKADGHRLWWRGRVIKQFKGDAPCQEAILHAFEAGGWPACVQVELPQDEGASAKRRLHDAIKNLNRSVRPHLHFSQEGGGGRVRWHGLDSAPPQSAGATPTLPQRNPNATLDRV